MTENEDSSGLEPTRALEKSQYADAPRHVRSVLEIVASGIEVERERLRPILGKGQYHARGLLRRNRDKVDSMNWEDLLLRPETIQRCAADAGITEPEVIKIVLRHCRPQNLSAFYWMNAFYGKPDKVEQKVPWPLVVQIARAAKTHTEQVATKKAAKNASDGGKAKNAPHADRADAIKMAWASGMYATRNLCAEKEWRSLGFKTEETARRRLTGTDDPNPWPAKGM